MKNKIYLLAFLILFQSCYSYKTFNIINYELIKPKKVKIELKDSKKLKGQIVEFNADKIKLEKFNKIIEIPVHEIKKIKGREFSIEKVSRLLFTLLLAITIGVLGSYASVF